MHEDLLTPLRDADVRPPRVDLGQAIRVGRRRRRIRHATVAGLTAAAVLATAVAVTAVTGRPQSMPAERTPRPLPTSTVAPPLGECSLSKDTAPYASRRPWVVLDDAWRVAVHLDAPGTAPVEAVRYKDGRVERIPDVPSRFQLTNVNGAGDFAGVDVNNERAWVYRDGRFSRLKLPEGATSVALTDMNEAGDLLGIVSTQATLGFEAVVWPGGRPGQPRVPAIPQGRSSRAYGLAWDGTVVGEVFLGDVVTPYLWHPDGSGEPLPMPAGHEGDVAVTGLTGDWAVGPGVRWNIRTGRADAVEGIDGSGFVDMYGRIYGLSDPQVVWINGTVRPLPQSFGGHKVQFQNIRDDGQQMYGLSGYDSTWVRWDC
ncbi:hypothetical protein Daura_01400 [Dactylosporangium aurantiacum]|uniref:Uncharacterized protein n=1 Tax=Dactylosporangium aurantiacum TaxID=35754 RepID=A0A9Q9MJS1_9ACTN|nr:hypothetical protein [Dactylosporangium aurantiacum]MDG6100979.1 hypothetical protein [Dactylosporangium aurantiacum]UWZ54971.1 hypothetical protein Daura_01400 [Dactylosporangium aurantiacum]